MKRFLSASALCLLAAGAFAGCTDEPSTTAAADTSPHLLKSDLPSAISVVEARKKEPGERFAVVGRVREKAKGVFQLVDDSIDYCGRGANTHCTCPTPWDYCCMDQDVVEKGTLVVRALDASGKPVSASDLGVRALDLVAVSGVWTKEEDGSKFLVAKDGWFRRERPKVGDNVKFE
jgi:hypothetical protein